MKYFTVVMSNKSEYVVSQEQLDKMLESKQGWVVLPSGSVINKSFIIEIRFNYDETMAHIPTQALLDDIPVIDTKLLEELKSKLVDTLSVGK